MAFMGTIVVSGRAKGVVVETGHSTVLGQIATEVREVAVIKTPLQDKLTRFAKLIGILVIAFSALIFGAGMLLGGKASEMFMVAVATAVSAIPEGLPVAVTITMAIGVARMARRNAVIRKLPAVETLGSTTVIGSDKTGTLTKNEMTVKVVYDGEKAYRISGIGYEPKGEILYELEPVDIKASANLLMVFRIGMLCNESNIYEEQGEFKVDGDPTEGALIVSAMKAGLNLIEETRHYPQTAMIPFESEHGYMATLHRHGEKKIFFVKGAPEKILDMCTECAKDKIETKEILNKANLFAREGMRVLAMAYKEAPHDIDEITHHDVDGNLVYVGLQGMIDPPRTDVMDAVKGCKKAGIKVVMITGDHAATASAIAKMLGITTEESGVMTGKEIEAMGDDELFNKVRDISVFARVSP
jgi:magnesium-transporting ATPase (P-type)